MVVRAICSATNDFIPLLLGMTYSTFRIDSAIAGASDHYTFDYVSSLTFSVPSLLRSVANELAPALFLLTLAYNVRKEGSCIQVIQRNVDLGSSSDNIRAGFELVEPC